jgi:hypothetical protein
VVVVVVDEVVELVELLVIPVTELWLELERRLLEQPPSPSAIVAIARRSVRRESRRMRREPSAGSAVPWSVSRGDRRSNGEATA